MSLILLIILGTTIWVAADAYHAGRSWGSIVSWVLGCGLFWIVFFPLYLATRRKFVELLNDETYENHDDMIRSGARHRHA